MFKRKSENPKPMIVKNAIHEKALFKHSILFIHRKLWILISQSKFNFDIFIPNQKKRIELTKDKMICN